jgi:hypothetical protein
MGVKAERDHLMVDLIELGRCGVVEPDATEASGLLARLIATGGSRSNGGK